jgi:curved DNA-binding protein CbpA
MEAKVTLYDILGVSRTASYRDIRAAYRNLTRKYHPDVPVTGSVDTFYRVCKAHEVLIDPTRRERYDRTGDISEGLPEDHLNQVALGLISQAISKLIGSDGDLRTVNLPKILTDHFMKSITDLEQRLTTLIRNKERAKSIAGRWRAKDDNDITVIEGVVNSQFHQLERMRTNILGQIQAYELAIEILTRYEFKHEDMARVVVYADSFYGVR